MFEIIPNWHPIFVHFTVALLSLAVGLFVVVHFAVFGVRSYVLHFLHGKVVSQPE
jgi:hypothetical protein